MRPTFLALPPLLLFVACAGMAEEPAHGPKSDEASSAAAEFSGRWSAEYPYDGKKLTLHLAFEGENRFSTESTLLIPSDANPEQMNEYPGPSCEYKYRRTAEGVWSVSMLSFRIEGQERITPEQKKPKQWKYRLKSKDELVITNPFPTEKSPRAERTYYFRRD